MIKIIQIKIILLSDINPCIFKGRKVYISTMYFFILSSRDKNVNWTLISLDIGHIKRTLTMPLNVPDQEEDAPDVESQPVDQGHPVHGGATSVPLNGGHRVKNVKSSEASTTVRIQNKMIQTWKI